MARKGYNFDFSPLQSKPEKHKDQAMPLWCDFIELLCIISYNGTLGRGELIDEVFDENKDFIVNEEDELDDMPDEDDSIDEQLASMGSRRAELSDKNDLYVSGWLNNIAARNEMLGDLYPFYLDTDGTTILLKKDLTYSHNLYLFLLLSSNLHLFSKKLSTKITTDFEFVCFKAQSIMFNTHSSASGISIQTHIFGKNPQNSGIFTGNLANKFLTLGRLIQTHDINVTFLKSYNSGDGGIDIVSVLKFNQDNAFGLPMVISQCACSYDDWKTKQEDHRMDNYRQIRLFDVDYLRLIFIPFFYRNQDGQWSNIEKIKISVIDRLRIMAVLMDENTSLSSYVDSWVSMLLAGDITNSQSIANDMAAA